MDIYEIRRRNLRQIRDDMGRGGQAKIADKLETPIPHVSAMIGKNPTRNIGTELARRVEKVFRKDSGWMDQLHEAKKGNVVQFPGQRVSPETTELVKQIDSLGPELKDALRKLLGSNSAHPHSGKAKKSKRQSRR